MIEKDRTRLVTEVMKPMFSLISLCAVVDLLGTAVMVYIWQVRSFLCYHKSGVFTGLIVLSPLLTKVFMIIVSLFCFLVMKIGVLALRMLKCWADLCYKKFVKVKWSSSNIIGCWGYVLKEWFHWKWYDFKHHKHPYIFFKENIHTYNSNQNVINFG